MWTNHKWTETCSTRNVQYAIGFTASEGTCPDLEHLLPSTVVRSPRLGQQLLHKMMADSNSFHSSSTRSKDLAKKLNAQPRLLMIWLNTPHATWNGAQAECTRGEFLSPLSLSNYMWGQTLTKKVTLRLSSRFVVVDCPAFVPTSSGFTSLISDMTVFEEHLKPIVWFLSPKLWVSWWYDPVPATFCTAQNLGNWTTYTVQSWPTSPLKQVIIYYL